MVFDEVLKRFIESRPVSVMHRAVLENVFAPQKLDAVFDGAAVKQYERELLFSTTVGVMSLVVARIAPSVRNAYFQKIDEVSVSIRSLYVTVQECQGGDSPRRAKLAGGGSEEGYSRPGYVRPASRRWARRYWRRSAASRRSSAR